MSDVLIDQDTMEDIGDAIREKLGVSDTYLPASMPAAIRSISGGSGGSAKYSETVLWSGHAMPANTEYVLTESIENFNALVLMGAGYETNSVSQMHIPLFVPTSQIEYGTTVDFGYLANGSNLSVERRPSLVFTDATHFKVINANTAGNTNCGFVSVIGIRWETMQTALIYSEEEREVGVWTDGKSLYQKTFNFVNVTTLNSWVSTNHNISNIDKITDYNAIFTRTSDNWTVKADHYEGSSTAYISSNADKTQIHFKIAISAGTYNGSFTICYTKTTDTAGSGTWTTKGEYAHHYSTTEHVIGTWTDGSTIYERTLPFTFSPVSDWALFNDDVSYNILLSATGYIVLANGEVYPFVSQSGLIPRWITKADHKLYYYTTENRAGHVTIQYTKTT